MSDLVRWLLEQIAEDERIAREELGRREQWRAELAEMHRRGNVPSLAFREYDEPGAPGDPVRALAECDAKRQIVKRHQSEDVDGRLPDGEEITLPCCVVCRDSNGMREEAPCQTLRLLALPYADRPGYREEWRP